MPSLCPAWECISYLCGVGWNPEYSSIEPHWRIEPLRNREPYLWNIDYSFPKARALHSTLVTVEDVFWARAGLRQGTLEGGWKSSALPRKAGSELVLISPQGISELLYIHPKTVPILEKEMSAEWLSVWGTKCLSDSSGKGEHRNKNGCCHWCIFRSG